MGREQRDIKQLVVHDKLGFRLLTAKKKTKKQKNKRRIMHSIALKKCWVVSVNKLLG